MSDLRDAMQGALAAVPTHALIGLEVIATGEDGPAIMEIPLSANALGATGRLHGGVIALLCDVTLAVAASSGSTYDHETQALVTADLHVRYLGTARGDRVRAEANVVKAGRALVVAEGRVTDSEGNLLAVADLSATIVQRMVR
jgi:uncharacterized protein (TIGR00369 family)